MTRLGARPSAKAAALSVAASRTTKGSRKSGEAPAGSEPSRV